MDILSSIITRFVVMEKRDGIDDIIEAIKFTLAKCNCSTRMDHEEKAF
jgi:hypothetical protein